MRRSLQSHHQQALILLFLSLYIILSRNHHDPQLPPKKRSNALFHVELFTDARAHNTHTLTHSHAHTHIPRPSVSILSTRNVEKTVDPPQDHSLRFFSIFIYLYVHEQVMLRHQKFYGKMRVNAIY